MVASFKLRDYTEELLSHKAEMLDFTLKCAEINSGSFNAEGVNKVLDYYKNGFSTLTPNLEQIKVDPLDIVNAKGSIEHVTLGDALKISKNNAEAKVKVLLVGHMDTVFAPDHDFQSIKFINDNVVNGPGVSDMKGGITVMLWALKMIEQTEFAKDIDWQVLLTPDEEIGSWGSGPLLAECAKNNDVGLIFEPSTDDKGTFAGARKGSGDFTLVAKGKAAHAGRSFYEGKNAIYSLSKVIKDIHALNGQRKDVTINIGKIIGGEAINIVPDTCVAKLGIRYPNSDDEHWVRSNIENIVQYHSKEDGVEFKVHGKFGRKPKSIVGKTAELYELVKNVGSELGHKIAWQATGGCCDGNNLAEHGLPNIDTLGVRGAKIHSSEEYMIIDSLVERAQLTLGILINLIKKW